MRALVILAGLSLSLFHACGDVIAAERPNIVFILADDTGGTQGPFAIRSGDWKFIQPGGGGRQAEQSKKDGTPAGQLFHLADDLGEQNNLVAKNPEKVAELQALFKQLRERGAIQKR